METNFLREDNLLSYQYLQALISESIQIFQKPFPHQIAGEIRLGYVSNTRTVMGITKEELNQHMLITGRSGAGKTNIMRIIQTELLRIGIPFLSFDLCKYNTRYLILQVNGITIIRCDNEHGEFFYNPLKPPPGVRADEWMLIFCEVTAESFGLLAASKSLLIDLVKELYTKFDVHKTGVYPTIHDLNQLLEEKRKKIKYGVEVDYIDRIRNKIKAICITLDSVLNVQEGIPIEELLNHPVCLELVGIGSSEIQTWLCSLIIAYISCYRIAQVHLGELRHVIFYDEAAHSFGKAKTGNTETFLIRAMRRLREYGEGIVMADQSISSLNDIIKSNVYTTTCLNQSGVKDTRESAEILRLDPTQAEVLNQLEPGQAIIKLAGRYPKPFAVNFPFIEPEYISDEELDQLNEDNIILKDLLSKVKPRKSEPMNIASSQPKQNELTDNEKQFLIAIYANQFRKTLTEIYEIAEFSAGTGSRLANTCEKRGLIKIIQTTLKTGRPKYPVLLSEAYEMMNLPEKKYYGKGAGLEHILYQHLIADHFKSYNPKIELNGRDKFIDVAIQIDDFLLAIEVAVSSVHEKQNIEKDIYSAKAGSVIIACKNQKVLNEIQEILSEMENELKNKTQTFLVSGILNQEPDKLIQSLMNSH